VHSPVLSRLSNRRSLTIGRGIVIAVLALALAAPLASAAQPKDIQLASGDSGRTLKLGDIANDDDLVAVVFQERNLSYVRWSNDAGSSFVPKVALRGGGRAKEPRVAVCDDMVFAVSIWQSAASRHVGLDYRNVVTGTSARFSLGAGSLADVACFGEVVAVTWVVDGHLWLAVHEGSCAKPCTPDFKLDLGSGNFDSPPRISSDGEGFVATWVTDGIAVQHFAYDAGGDAFNIAPGPVVTLMAGKDVSLPVIAGRGPRVALAYQRDGQTHLRTSDDYGTPFGPRIIVSRYCRDCPRGGSEPLSVDIRDDVILVEVLRVDGRATPAAISSHGLVSTNNGSQWSSTTGHVGGVQMGVILTTTSIAEVWDVTFYSDFPYHAPQEIGYHIHNL
jgi:hypothetical protein